MRAIALTVDARFCKDAEERKKEVARAEKSEAGVEGGRGEYVERREAQWR